MKGTMLKQCKFQEKKFSEIHIVSLQLTHKLTLFRTFTYCERPTSKAPFKYQGGHLDHSKNP